MSISGPVYELSQHSMDIVLKLEADHLAQALPRRYRLKLAPIVRPLPTELPRARLSLERIDTLFELENDSLLHIEFQGEYRLEHLIRFAGYNLDLFARYRKPVHPLVIYGRNVARADTRLAMGGLQYRVRSIFLGKQNGDATLRRLQRQLARQGSLAPEERLDLVLLPLMRHTGSNIQLLRSAVALARQLPGLEQDQTVASLIGLGGHFLSADERDALMEALMATDMVREMVERSIAKGLEQGREQGLAEGREQGREQGELRKAQDLVLRALARRFGEVPAPLGEEIGSVHDTGRLDALFDLALSAATLEEFVQAFHTAAQ